MPLLSFTVFKEKILDGSKTQTIRKMRKHPIKMGDKLYLYWHCRQKDCEKIGVSVCTDVCTVRIDQTYWLGKQRLQISLFDEQTQDKNGWINLWNPLSPTLINDISRKDGFDSEDDMLKWFSKTHTLPEVFQLIRWKPLIQFRGKEQ